MINKKVKALYFSATDTTKKVVTKITEIINENINNKMTIENINFTFPQVRNNEISFGEDDVVIVGVPVYAGRIPNVLLKFLNSIRGNGAIAIAVVVYGNRNYDDTLIELKDILESRDFKVIAGGAFIGEHSFSKTLAKNRPDEKDMEIIKGFADKIYLKLSKEKNYDDVVVKGNKPYRPYYKPINKYGVQVDIRKVAPKTNSNCNVCKLCVDVCPMGSITNEDVSLLRGICIKCGACIKKCPNNAKYYDDHNYLYHKVELEEQFAYRREPEIFI
ncbi:EFR1 family ferrodoxin [Oceanirhabdus sp. W0125-5]|uniref:EFR1 family ferrodoxin n=1 Tax=Oceanirhabdus sp. W0125-5 TaxID=2999116 RepID=UPI0022F2FD96|nr:EFR1 family ferrodoxin [Oceanirhabdus sp. W0125-5]WBW96198.1 EFR1 family ferrodoxin [Oceanirhabdus sp. W0125-5]